MTKKGCENLLYRLIDIRINFLASRSCSYRRSTFHLVDTLHCSILNNLREETIYDYVIDYLPDESYIVALCVNNNELSPGGTHGNEFA